MMKSTVEIWRDIKDYEGLYKVSNLGRVKSVDHYVCYNKRNNKLSLCKGRLLRPVANNMGYLRVNLSKEGNTQPYLIHRLVAETFIPNPDNLPEVNHKDETPKHNYVENLEWCSHIYNMGYGTILERKSKKMTGKPSSHISPVQQYNLDGELISEYKSMTEAHKRTGISLSNICFSCNNEGKTAGGYRWIKKN